MDVVIVAYGPHDRLRRCLEALRAHPPSEPLHVTVVDNGRDPVTEDVVRGLFPTAVVVSPSENLGFARATNLGIRQGASDYVLIVNPDTEVRPETLGRLTAVLDARPNVAVVGPSLVRLDGSFDHAARRAFPSVAGAIGHFVGIGRLLHRSRLSQYRAPDVESGPVDAINGAFMLGRRSALESAGLLDERYWMYMEDLDLLYRLKEAGWLTWFEPTAVAIHVKRGTTGGVRTPRLVWAFHRSMLRFYRSYYAPRRSRVTNALVYAGIAARAAGAVTGSAVARPALVRWNRRHDPARTTEREHAPADAATVVS